MHRSLLVIATGLLVVTACGDDEATPPAAAPARVQTGGATLYWVDVGGRMVFRATGPDFDDAEAIVIESDIGPDGVAADVQGGTLYWTAMGDLYGAGGGSLQTSTLDGEDVRRIVEPGITHTPKQLQLDLTNRHVYWADREGAKVWRAGLDGTNPEVVVSGHGLQQLVGVALDVPSRKVYFSDRNGKTIQRVGMDLPPGEDAGNRSDVELLHASTGAAMPLDLEIDLGRRQLYWTDRFHGTVQRMGLDLPAGQAPQTRTDVETLVTGLQEPIGIALDLDAERLYFGVLGGFVYEAALDGGDPRKVAQSGSVAGLALVPQD